MKKLSKKQNKCSSGGGGANLTKTSIEKGDNKRKIITILLLVILLMLSVGISFAVWNYGFIGSANTINTGDVSLEFLESNSNIISIENALPISDTDGKNQSETFDFSVKTTTSKPIDITYGVYLEKLSVDTNMTALTDDEVKVYLTDYEGNVLLNPTKISDLNSEKMIYADTNTHDGTTREISKKFKLRVWLDSKVEASKFYDENTQTVKKYQYKFKVGVKTRDNLDISGANVPVLTSNMIAVYYDEDAEVWKKADSTNNSKTYKWYDYNDKMWANSVTVSETNRSTYKNASPGTTIPMDDILTMQVWIPRYKYKVWNYNADGTVTSEPQEIEITFENGTETTGEISCTDSISGTDGDPSETCKLKSTNATCTDSTCNGKTYNHPAFTFGSQELEGMWVGKFETTGTISDITIKPDVQSLRSQKVSSFETNIMAMNDSGNKYGFASTDDTHMMKNQEWGAVAYLSHSKYGINKEININNSSSYYTGRSGGNVGGQTPINGTYTDQTSTTTYNSYGFYTYDGYLLNYNTNTKSSTKDMSKVASTTGNIYGIYDMSGGAWEYVMGNIVSNDGTTMMAGYSNTGDYVGYHSGYTGILYESVTYTSYTGIAYPENKYLDKYSFGTSITQKKRSKLGDAVKEVTATSGAGWYSDYGYVAFAPRPWFGRGGGCDSGASAGVMSSDYYPGDADGFLSARVVVLVP
ncbi:MAG: hypothetical protein ACI31R_04220 [Bacilli bacterium]